MNPWIKKNEKELRKLYYSTHRSLSGMTSIPSKSISFEEWAEYAESFKDTHADFINITKDKTLAKSDKHRIVAIVKKDKTIYQIQRKYLLFGWLKKRIVFKFLNMELNTPDKALDIYNILELKN